MIIKEDTTMKRRVCEWELSYNEIYVETTYRVAKIDWDGCSNYEDRMESSERYLNRRSGGIESLLYRF